MTGWESHGCLYRGYPNSMAGGEGLEILGHPVQWGIMVSS